MTKIVRAFSLDPRISEGIDDHTRVPGVAKPMNKSKFVNDALDWYMNKNLRDYIEQQKVARQNLSQGLRDKDVIIGGLERQVALLSDHRPWCCRIFRRLRKHP